MITCVCRKAVPATAKNPAITPTNIALAYNIPESERLKKLNSVILKTKSLFNNSIVDSLLKSGKATCPRKAARKARLGLTCNTTAIKKGKRAKSNQGILKKVPNIAETIKFANIARVNFI
jgi:hypothetical protein